MSLDFSNEVKKVISKHGKDNVLAVYLTGSHLNNLNNKNSDVDFYVILRQKKKNLVFGSFESGENHEGNLEYKYMELFKFVQLLGKTNPNVLELVFKEPLFYHTDYHLLEQFLYDNRNRLPFLNTSRYFSSAYHMAKNNYNKLLNGTGKVSQGKAGKEVMNFYKAFYQVSDLLLKYNIDDAVRFTGDRRIFLLKIKEIQEYSEQERLDELRSMESKLEFMEDAKDAFKSTNFDDELFNEILEYLHV